MYWPAKDKVKTGSCFWIPPCSDPSIELCALEYPLFVTNISDAPISMLALVILKFFFRSQTGWITSGHCWWTHSLLRLWSLRCRLTWHIVVGATDTGATVDTVDIVSVVVLIAVVRFRAKRQRAHAKRNDDNRNNTTTANNNTNANVQQHQSIYKRKQGEHSFGLAFSPIPDASGASVKTSMVDAVWSPFVVTAPSIGRLVANGLLGVVATAATCTDRFSRAKINRRTYCWHNAVGRKPTRHCCATVHVGKRRWQSFQHVASDRGDANGAGVEFAKRGRVGRRN